MVQDEKLGKTYQKFTKKLVVSGNHNTSVYSAVSELSRRNNQSRNEVAVRLFDKIVQETLKPNAIASEWWRKPTHKLEELVIKFARGIVYEVRTISIKICNKKLAKKVMIVLAGSGFDRFIKENGLDSYLELASECCTGTLEPIH